MKTQNAKIIAHLRAGNTLTPIEALHLFGTLRLGARIYDLKKSGENISADRVHIGNNRTVARYRLHAAPKISGDAQ
jgi:Helix-turn-helix domain